jgi:bifunctional non-homologous end joining protein LigD
LADLRLRPIEARREALKQLVAGVDGILFSDALVADGAVVFAKACELGLEGIVSKRASSFYKSAARTRAQNAGGDRKLAWARVNEDLS